MTRLRTRLLKKFGFKIAILEDQNDEMAVACQAVEGIGLVPVPMSSYDDFKFDDDPLLVGVLSDIHIHNMPVGLGLIAKCLQDSVPVCAVTYVIGHDLANWKGPLVDLLKNQGITFFTGKVDGYKEWSAAVEVLADQFHDKLMGGTDAMARSYQRYNKYVSAIP